MNELRATPGPWTEGIEGNLRIYGPDGMGEHSGLIAQVYKGRENLRLMLAARDLYEALEEAEKDLVAAQVNARMAAKHDPKWAGVAEAIQPSIDRSRAVRAKARGECTDG